MSKRRKGKVEEEDEQEDGGVSNWIITSFQLHWVTSGRMNKKFN